MKKKIIFVIMLFSCCIFTVILLNATSSKEKAKKNAKGFLTVVFNSPDPELHEMFTEIAASVGKKPEEIDIGKRMRDLFFPYFTDSSLDKSVVVWSTFGPILEGTEYSSKIKQNSIKVTENKKDKNSLDFNGMLEYGKNTENNKLMEISGNIRYDQKTGKLNYFRFSLDTQRVIADMQRIAKEDTESLK